jgi:hypothetical protein
LENSTGSVCDCSLSLHLFHVMLCYVMFSTDVIDRASTVLSEIFCRTDIVVNSVLSVALISICYSLTLCHIIINDVSESGMGI